METFDEIADKKRVKKFSKTWLNDERYKLWIRQVLSDDTLFHYSVCNKNFSCSSNVSKHMDSACHKNNMQGTSISACEDNLQNKKTQYKKKFRPQWLDIEEFKSWLREVPDKASFFFCLICDRSIVGGLSQIYRHAESKMHRDKSEKSDITNKSNNDVNTQTDESLLTFDEQKKSAEIRYAALITEKNIPHQNAKEILNFF